MSLLDYHYVVRFDELVRGFTALADVFDVMDRYDQGAMLELLLPGVADPRGCWENLARPLNELARLDSKTALEMQRDLGARGALTPQVAYDRVRGDLELQIGDIIREHRNDVKAA